MSEQRCVFLGESKSALFGLQKVDAIRNRWLRLFTTEWMNEWCTYIALYCVLLYTQSAVQSCGGGGGSPQPPPVCSIHLVDAMAATGQWLQCAHHTPATGGEEREIVPIKWMGIIRWLWLTRASGGNLVRIFNDHRESGPRFNVSSER